MSREKTEVLHTIQHAGIVPMFNHPDLDLAKHIVEACRSGGARVIEYTIRKPFAFEDFAALRRFVSVEFPDVIFGAGSIVDAAGASMAMQMGADFIVTPVLREDIAVVCNRRRVAWSPGCSTLKEIATAEELGSDLIKLFPGNVLGPGFVKAILSPSPRTRVMVTGGVEPTRESLTPWFEAGVVCVGMGSRLVRKDLIEARDYTSIQRLYSNGLQIIRELGFIAQ